MSKFPALLAVGVILLIAAFAAPVSRQVKHSLIGMGATCVAIGSIVYSQTLTQNPRRAYRTDLDTKDGVAQLRLRSTYANTADPAKVMPEFTD